MVYWTKTKKILKGAFVGTFIATGTCFACFSCSKPYSYTWSGLGDSFVIDYAKFSSPTIKSSDVLDCYMKNNNFYNMMAEDVIYIMNHDWSLWSPSLNLKYQIVVWPNSDNRIGWDLQIFDSQNNQLLWWTVQNLKYTWSYDNNDNSIVLLPLNVQINQFGGYEVLDAFWDDPLFDIVVKHRSTASSRWDSFEFSFKTSLKIEKEEFEDEYVQYFSFTPHYYEDVTVEG